VTGPNKARHLFGERRAGTQYCDGLQTCRPGFESRLRQIFSLLHIIGGTGDSLAQGIKWPELEDAEVKNGAAWHKDLLVKSKTLPLPP
jgi:hypothetical protein